MYYVMLTNDYIWYITIYFLVTEHLKVGNCGSKYLFCKYKM